MFLFDCDGIYYAYLNCCCDGVSGLELTMRGGHRCTMARRQAPTKGGGGTGYLTE